MENNKLLNRCKCIVRAVKGKFKYATTCLSVMLGMFLVTGGPITAWAAPKEEEQGKDPFGFFTDGSVKDNKAFDKVTKTVKATGISGMNLMTAVGAVCLVFAVILAGITVSLKKGGKREEGKENLQWAAIGGMVIFGALGIAGMIAGIGSSIGG